MILYGRFHSPYVRRIAIWLNLQGRTFEHHPLMVTGDDFEALKKINPVGRVPALKLDDGTILIETAPIIDWIEETAPEAQRLLPSGGGPRLQANQQIAFANSLAEKAVALVYEITRRPAEYQWPEWADRLKAQCTAALETLESQTPADTWFGGAEPNGADVAAVASFDFIGRTHPELAEGYAKLPALSQRASQHDAFASTRPQ